MNQFLIDPGSAYAGGRLLLKAMQHINSFDRASRLDREQFYRIKENGERWKD